MALPWTVLADVAIRRCELHKLAAVAEEVASVAGRLRFALYEADGDAAKFRVEPSAHALATELP